MTCLVCALMFVFVLVCLYVCVVLFVCFFCINVCVWGSVVISMCSFDDWLRLTMCICVLTCPLSFPNRHSRRCAFQKGHVGFLHRVQCVHVKTVTKVHRRTDHGSAGMLINIVHFSPLRLCTHSLQQTHDCLFTHPFIPTHVLFISMSLRFCMTTY